MLLKSQITANAVFKVVNPDGSTFRITIDDVKAYEIATTIEKWVGLEVVDTGTRYFDSLDNAQAVLNKHQASPSC